jgi:pimeloyl-ACP methyl ester carboxylesterase
MHDAIAGSKLKVIYGAGHNSNLEKPDHLDSIVSDFCLHLSAK